MILVRDVFRFKREKLQRVNMLWEELKKKEKKLGYPFMRVMTEVSDEYPTVVVETAYADVSEFEQTSRESRTAREFEKWYSKFTPLVEGNHREIFTVLD